MKLKLVKTSPVQLKEHAFLNQHPLNLIPEKGATKGMLCRRADKNSAEFVPLPRLENVMFALEKHSVQLRFNSFVRSVEISGTLKSDDKGELNSAKLMKVRFELEKIYGMKIPENDLRSMLETIARENEYDPLGEYHLGLLWDGTKRAETLWIDYANAEDTALNRAYARLFLTQMVARCFWPGIKVDEVITLIGDQGGGKSTLARNLTPINEQYFTDQVVIGSDAKKMIEQTKGEALAEHAEDWRGKYGEQQRKACLSTTADMARGAYRRMPEEVPRRFMFISTTNSDFPVQDPTGARREWLISTKGQFKPLTPDIRDQLYAEIMETVARPILESSACEEEQRKAIRARIVLPKELWPEQAKVAESFRAPPELLIEVKFALKTKQWPTEINIDEILEALSVQNGKVSAPKSANQKISAAMKYLGYRSERKNTKGGGKVRVYFWDKPSEPQEFLSDDITDCSII